MTDFYASYAAFKDYATPVLKPKHIRRYDRDVGGPLGLAPGQAVLEVGCGTGLFLAYLKARGIDDILGIDQDPKLADAIPEAVRDTFQVADVWAFLDTTDRTFDRIALFDVLEHFTAEEGVTLMAGLAARLRPGGRIVVKVPNMGSPWGAQHQFGDLTHKTGYAPNALRQLAIAAGLTCTRCYPHPEGSPTRLVLDRLVHGLLNRMLQSPPEVWTANVFAIFERR